MSDENMIHWDVLKKTDPSTTSTISFGAMKGKTSIATLGPVLAMTRHFGPVGIGWGYEIVEEKYIEGGYIYPVKPQDYKGETPQHPMMREQLHIIRLKAWAVSDDQRMEAEQFGTTKVLSQSKWGGPEMDDEYPKKTLSDALKKTLTLFGVNADVHLGEFDNAEYRAEREQDEAIEKADDRDAALAKQQGEYDEWKAKNTPLMTGSVRLSELEGMYNTSARKAARMADVKYVKELDKIWRSRVEHFMGASDQVALLSTIYETAKVRAKGWGPSGAEWLAKLAEKGAERKAELTPTEKVA